VTELLRVPLGPDGDLVMVRASVRQATALLGLGQQDQTRLATAAAEAARSTCAPGGGTMRLSVATEAGTAGTLCVEFTPATGRRAPGPDGRTDVLERLLDRFDTSEQGWLLGKRLPAGDPPTEARLEVVRQALTADTDLDPVVVLHEQNSELATALAQLRSRESELVRLNKELVETNRGVLALYS
jgi:phosphoserine phosphatase RsbU/P